MSDSDAATITALLERYTAGDAQALGTLMPLVYQELKNIASRQLRRLGPQTLNTTGLVNEVYLKIAAQSHLPVASRAHFYAIAARAMRQLLVDHLRRRGAAKRGDGVLAERLREGHNVTPDQGEFWLRVDEALRAIQEHDERLVRILECRVFAGYSNQEIAEVLGVSARTVQRDWLRAKAWLNRSLATG